MAAAKKRLSKTKVWALPADVCVKFKSTEMKSLQSKTTKIDRINLRHELSLKNNS